MQAAVDAMHPNRNHHHHRPRTHHPRNQVTTASGSASVSSSASGQGSQAHSRNQSTSGMRHATHSNVGSIHSSPLRSSSKQIDDNSSLAAPPTNATASRSISVRSSRVGSPTPSTHAAPASTTSTGDANMNPSAPNGTAVPPPNGISELTQPQSELHETRPLAYPPSIPAPHPPGPHNNSFPSSRASGSPVSIPYALPPYPAGSYAGQQIPYPPGPPPYPMYAPYAYAYPHPPYIYWGTQSHPHSHSPRVQADGIPPQTMMARPPLPDESDSSTSYRDANFVMPPPVLYPVPTVEQIGESEQFGARGRRQRELSFGSISAVENKTPSPPVIVAEGSSTDNMGATGGLGLDTGVAALSLSEGPKTGTSEREESDRAFTTFSIGVAPEEAGSIRIRSRTRTGSKASRRSEGAISKSTSEQTDALPEARDAEEEADGAVAAELASKDETAQPTDAKVIDLTESETKWQFGTTKQEEAKEDIAGPAANQDSQNAGLEVQGAKQTDVIHEGQLGEAEQSAFPTVPNALGVLPGSIPAPIPVGGPVPLSYPPAQGSAHIHGYSGGAIPHLSLMTNGFPHFSPPYALQSALPPSSAPDVIGDEWKVKDYGYGFGRGGASGNGGYSASREDRQYRNERERDWERRDYQQQDREYYGRPRRGSYNAGYNNYDRGGHERGGYGGRRGRASYGRGFRGGSRGAYAASQRQSAFTAMSQPPPTANDINGYYAPIPPIPPYIPAYDPYGYPEYAPVPQSTQAMLPLPEPLSRLSFPLDPVRYRLLGQLEYYLSPQNMARDIFLRRKV